MLLITAGCVRYDETIEIHADRSGSATLILERPDNARAEAAAEMFDPKHLGQDLPPNIQLNFQSASTNGRVTITATYTFDDFRSLIAWAANKRTPLNNISILERSGELEISRRIAPIEDSTAEDLKQFGSDITVTFALKGPGTLIDTNASRSDGQTATWMFKAPELFGPTGRTLTARFATGRTTAVYVLAALALLALNIMMAVWFRKRRRTQIERSAQTHL